MSRPRVATIVLVAVCVIARLAFCGFGRDYVERTSNETLRDTLGFREIAGIYARQGPFAKLPETVIPRTPLYPMLLAGVIRVAGDGYWPIRVVQTLLQALSLLLLLRWARELFDERTAVVAGALFALNPFFTFYTAFELVETLAVVLVLAIAVLARRMQSTWDAGWAAGLGMVIGLSYQARPTLGQAGLLLLGLLGLLAWRDRRARRALGAAVLAFALTGLPWVLANWVHLGKPVLLNLGIGRGLYAECNPMAHTGSGIEGVDYVVPPEVASMTPEEQDRWFRERAIAWIREDPLRYAGRCLWRLWRMWQPLPTASQFAGGSKAAIALLGEGVFLPLAALGLWRTRRRWRELLWWHCLALGVCAAHSLIVSGMRYRLPLMPCALVLAATVLVAAWDAWRARAQRRPEQTAITNSGS